MAKVTYLLGAGASRGIVPIVEEIPKKLIDLAKEIESLENHSSGMRSAFARFPNFLRTLATKAIQYNTIDSYAQYLSQSGNDDQIRLDDLKIALAFLISYEQLGKNPHNRYNQLWTKLWPHLSENEKGMGGGINFLTWNYDLQLELSFDALFNRNETGLEGTLRKLNTWPVPWETRLSSHELKIIHLNGLAGIYMKRYHVFDDYVLSKVEDADIMTKMGSIHSFLYEKDDSKWPISSAIKFYWEMDDARRKLNDQAVDIMRNSDCVIVIGYSFPSENRALDRRLFSSLKPTVDLVIQDPKPNSDYIRPLLPRRVTPRLITNVDSFHFPDVLTENY